MNAFADALRQACASWPLILSDGQIQSMQDFAMLLLEANERTNLTAITGLDEMARLHFADSLLPFGLGLDMRGNCIDVGTGAGFPGVPLALAYGELSMALLDSLGKRTEFLQAACKAVRLDVQIYTMRAETAGRDTAFREKFDIAVSRAVAPLSVLAELMLPLIRVGGKAIAWKGPRAREELTQAVEALKLLGAEAEIIQTTLPWGERAMIVMQKKRETPVKYPRRPGIPEKRPLGKIIDSRERQRIE